MSLTDQLQTVLSSVAALEKTVSAQTTQVATLTDQVRTLATTNAALRQQLATSPAAPSTPPALTPTPTSPLTPVTAPVPTPPPAPAAPAPLEWGFVGNDGDAPVAIRAGLTRMAADGGRWLRLWHSTFGQLSTGTVALIDAAAALGVRVVLCVQPKDGQAKTLGAPDFTTFVARNTPALRKLAYVEAGNELNLNQYRPDDLGGGTDWHGPYVGRWLRPLSTALAAIGVKTLCTSVTDTYHPDTYATQYAALLAAGAADCCDGLAIHAYFLPQYLQTLSTILTDLKTAWGKPLYVTECNVQTKGLTPAQWQTRFPPYLDTLHTAGVAATMFYRGTARTENNWSWPVLFDATGKPTDAYTLLLAAVRPTRV